MTELAEESLPDQFYGAVFIETVITQVQHRLTELDKLHQVLLGNVLHINHPRFLCYLPYHIFDISIHYNHSIFVIRMFIHEIS